MFAASARSYIARALSQPPSLDIHLLVFMPKRLVGRVSARDISVRLHHPFTSNSFGPVFAGSIVTEDGQTVVRGAFRLHMYARTFMKFWFGFIIVWSTIGIPAGLIQLAVGRLEGAMFAFGIVFVKLGEYLGNKDCKPITQACRGTPSTDPSVTW